MQRKKILIASLAIALLVGVVSAATIEWFGQVKMTATVSQAVLLDGYSYPHVIEDTVNVAGGESFCRYHWLTSQTSVPVTVVFETTYSPELTDNEITTSYRKLPFEVTPHSTQNEINKAAGHPYIEWTIEGNGITFNFANPTNWLFAFDYRVDGEPGTWTEWSGIVINGGELIGQEIGPSYNIVNVPAKSNVTVTVTACKEVQVGLRLGPENDWYLNWIVFEAPKLPTQITLQPGETLNFSICYEFAVDIYPYTYTITTAVKPVL